MILNKEAFVFQTRSVLGSNHFGFRLISLFSLSRKRRKLLVGPKTGICIEGYPRCANTFAVLAFEVVQNDAIPIAHHMHLAGQVLYSVKKGIPAIVLVREPLDACSSMLLREPGLSAELCLKLYIDFHKPLASFLDRIVVAPFDQVTTDYASIIERVNKMYSTDFCIYKNSPDADAKVFQMMSNLPSRENELTVSRPTKEKMAKKEEILVMFNTRACQRLLKDCHEIYTEFRAYC
jgi:hypothetical protein